MLISLAKNHGTATLWLVLGGISSAIALMYGSLWFRARASGGNRRYGAATWGLIAWAVLCFTRAATL